MFAVDSSLQNKRLLANDCAIRCSSKVCRTFGHKPLDSVAPFERDEIIIGRKIGSGTYSYVYEIEAFRLHPNQSSIYTDEQNEKREAIAHSTSKGAKYVMKCLKDDLEHAEDDEDLFLEAAHDIMNEAELLAALSHPNIVKLHGVVASRHEAFLDGASSFFIILERLQCTLTEKIEAWANETKASANLSCSLKLKSLKSSFNGMSRRCRSSGALDKLETALKTEESGGYLQQRFHVAASLAQAVEYLHSKRVIFHDIKPNNIGFDRKNCLKLFDFGLARFLPQDGEGYDDLFELSGAGTPRYTASECFFGKPYNLKSDVYSFGVVFWEIMCLRKPFAKYKRRKEFEKALVKVEQVLNINRRWSQPIQDIIRKCLPQQSQRPRMAEIKHILLDSCDLSLRTDDICESVITDANTDAGRQQRLRGSSFSSIVSDTPVHLDIEQNRFFEASKTTVSTFEGDSLHSLAD